MEIVKWRLSIVLMFWTMCMGQSNPELWVSKSKIAEAKSFVKHHNLNSSYIIFVDFSIPSGKKRMYLYDALKDSILRSDMVTHGICDNTTNPNMEFFSNEVNSHCSSLGKYRLGIRSYSSWGINIHYKLHGLEPSNNNAYKRVIVFHSWDAVNEDEIDPYMLPNSWGCPAVANNTMRFYDRLLKKEENVLMWLYD